MKTYKFTPEDVLAEVLKLAEERPDFVYRAQAVPADGERGSGYCSYLHAIGSTEGEGCIVGQALRRLGVSDEDLEEMEGDDATGAVTRLLGGAGYDAPATRTLGFIQARQDRGASWGVAVKSDD